MPALVHRWSPKPPESYGWPVGLDTGTWNLAWLTLPREGMYPPRSGALDAVLGSLDCEGVSPRGPAQIGFLLDLPARHFVVLMKASRWEQPPPVFSIDSNWRKNWVIRAQRARPNHPFDLNLCIDADLHSTALARQLMIEKGWTSAFQEAQR